MENIYECIKWRMENKFSRLLCAGVALRRTEVFSFRKNRCRRELEHRQQCTQTQMEKTIRHRVLKCSIHVTKLFSPDRFDRLCSGVCDEWYIVELMLLSLYIVFALRLCIFHFTDSPFCFGFIHFSCRIYFPQRCLSQCFNQSSFARNDATHLRT